MKEITKLEFTLDKIIEAVSSLDFEEKCQLREVIEQQIFEAEEESYQDDIDTVEELKLVRNEYQQGDYITLDDFLSANKES